MSMSLHTHVKAYHVTHKYFLLLIHVMHHIGEEVVEETPNVDVNPKPKCATSSSEILLYLNGEKFITSLNFYKSLFFPP